MRINLRRLHPVEIWIGVCALSLTVHGGVTFAQTTGPVTLAFEGHGACAGEMLRRRVRLSGVSCWLCS